MSYTGLTGWLARDRLDVSLAKAVLVLSILLLGLNLLETQIFLLVIPVASGVGSGLYLLTRSPEARNVLRRTHPTRLETPTVSRGVLGYLPAVVMLALAALVLWLQQTGVRTDGIYLLTGLIGVAIFVQILFVRDDRIAPALILFQILAAALVIRLAALAVTPGYVGVDIWTHATVFVEGITQDGSLSALANNKYLTAPFYHVIGAIGSLVIGSTRYGVYLTLGVIVPLSVLLVYATARLLIPARWALLATAFLAFGDQVIRWGIHIIPTSLGLVFFLAVVYALTRVYTHDGELWIVALLLVASLAIVFTHQVSTFITLVVLGVASVVALLTAGLDLSDTPSGGLRQAFAVGGVFAITLATTLLTWSVTPFTRGRTFLWGELAILNRLFRESVGFLNLAGSGAEASTSIGGPTQTGTLLNTSAPYIEIFGFGLLLLAAVMGGLYMLHWKGGAALTSTYLLTAGVLFVFVFGLSLFGIRALLPGRWMAFLYVALSLLAAVGLYQLSEGTSRRLAVAVFVLVAVGYPTTMVVAEKATLDNPAFEDRHKRFAYTEAEIASVESISAIYPPGDGRLIGTDHPFVGLFARYGGYETEASILILGPDGPEEAQAAVYRDYQSVGPITFHREPDSSVTALPTNVESSVCPPGWNVLYANDEVTFCTPPGGEA